MAAAGLPTIHVYLDDGTGTFPYDITSYARLREGYTITRGRSNELANVEPGTLTLTLDNTDGRFTLGAVTYGTHLDQRIRVTATRGATTSNRFTGYVQAWPVNWPDGSQAFSLCSITAVDASARWSRKTLSSVIGNEYLLADPAVYYPMQEPEGSTIAYPADGTQNPLTRLGSGGVDPVFGSPGVVEGQTSVLFNSGYLDSGYMGAPLAAPVVSDSTRDLVIEAFINLTATDGNILTLASTTNALRLSTTGGTTIEAIHSVMTASAAITFGVWHHVAAVLTDDGFAQSLDLYIDGVLADTASAATPGTVTFTAIDTVGLVQASIAHVAVSADVAGIPARAASAAGFTGETSDLRIDRLIGYEGTLTTTSGDTGMVTMPTQDTTGKSVAEAVQSVVDAEVGLLWINGTGQAQYANKDHVALATTPAMTVTISSDMVDPGTGFSVDMQQVTNFVTGQREGGGVQTVLDAASIGTGGTGHGTYPQSYTWLVQTDVEALSRAQWLVSKYAEPSPRLPTLDLDLMSADSANQILALGLDLTSHIEVTGWPSQSPAGADTDLVIEGYSESLSLDGWHLVTNCASWTQQAAFILNDASWGVLDTNSLGI